MITTHEEGVKNGRLGGNATKARMLAKNPYYYEEIGLLGGLKMRERGSEYYSRISKEWRAKQKQEADQCSSQPS